MNLMANKRVIKKIQDLAADENCDPNIRAIAKRKLAEFKLLNPNLYHEAEIGLRLNGARRRNPPNPRMQPRPDWLKFRFMDMETWGKTVNQDPTCMVTHNGLTYRIVLFEFKKAKVWRWLRREVIKDEPILSGKFATMDEAKRDAWDKLMTL